MENKLKDWSEKTGYSVEELTKMWQAKLAESRTLWPGKTEDWYKQRALNNLYLELKAELRSPAISFEMYCLGFGPLWDMSQRQRQLALDAWKENPEKALKEGLVDADGNPVDNRRTFDDGRRNPWYGKPLRPILTREFVGVGYPSHSKELKLISARIIGDVAKDIMLIPGNTYKFKGVMRDNLPSLYSCSMSTRKTPIQINNMYDSPWSLIHSIRKPLIADIHHEAMIPRRLTLVEGDVVFIASEPTSYGSRLIVIEDESTYGFDKEGLTVWCHEDIDIDFGRGTRVGVIGRTIVGAGWNPETRTLDEKIERLMINAFGVHPDPETKTPIEEIVADEVQ